MTVITDIIKKLKDIKEKDGDLRITWGDGYFAETDPNIMLLAKNDLTSLPRRVCFSCTLPYRHIIRIVTDKGK